MRIRLFNRIVLAFCTFLSIFIFYNITVYAKQNQRQTIKIAYPIQKGLTGFDEYGNYNGYTYEYLEEIAQYTGWDYEFVQIPDADLNTSLQVLMEKVRNGEVDIMGGMLYNPQLSEIYDFAGHSYGISETVLQVLSDDSRDIVIDSQKAQTFKIAVYKDAKRYIQELTEYCQMNLIEPEFVYCETEKEQLQALKDKRADMLLNSSVNYIEGLRTVAKFAPKPFYFVTTKNNTGLIQKLNAAIVNIEQADPYFSTMLHEKYFSPTTPKLQLSDSEQVFVEQSDIIRVGVLTQRPPFQYEDSETKKLKGIAVDLLNYISEKTGLRFEFIRANNMDKLYQMAEAKEIDMIAGIPYSYELARNRNLAMTRSYVSAQYILLVNESVNEDTLKGKRLAMTATSPYHGEFLGKVVRYDTTVECVRAVNNADADYMYIDSYAAQYYVNLPEFRRLKMAPQTYDPYEVCFGIAKPSSVEILSIMNKAILSIPLEDMQAIIYQNTTYKNDITLEYFVKYNPLETTLIFISIIFVILAIIFFNLYHRTKIHKQASLEFRKHLRVYRLVNDYFFEYEYKTNTFILSCPAKNQNSPSELQKFNFSNIDEKKEKEKYRFLSLIQSQSDGIKEAQFVCSDGKNHWIRMALETIYDDLGFPAYVIGKINNIDDEKKEKEKLLEQAQRDSLTQLFNTKTSRKLICQAISELTPQSYGALLILDVDNFKQVNDTYGHLQGDQTLSKVANLLKESFRSDDVIGRPGGDEFVIYMKKVKDKQALMEKCCILCQNARKICIAENKFLSISLGAALVCQGTDYEAAYQKADEALYFAKVHGRDQFMVYETQ